MEKVYPECEKLQKVSDKSQVLGEFIEWLGDRGIVLCKMVEVEGAYPQDQYMPLYQGVEQVLAEYFGIDLGKVEAEKREMLRQIREIKDARP